jgi:hypothetical protein
MTPLFNLSHDRPSETLLDQDSARTALDELFTLAGKYNSSDAYLELMRFVGRFRFYSPFNAMLIYTQMPGADFVCTARRWRKDYRREIKVSARPIVILQPMGPILFVFDVSDTAPLPNARPLPIQVEDPFQVRNGKIGGQLALTTENAKRDGVRVSERADGSQRAGSHPTGRSRAASGIYDRTEVDAKNGANSLVVRTSVEQHLFSRSPIRNSRSRACTFVLWSLGHAE